MDTSDDPPYQQAKRLAAAGDPAPLAALADAGDPRACQRLGSRLCESGNPAEQARGDGLLLSHGRAGCARDGAAATRMPLATACPPIRTRLRAGCAWRPRRGEVMAVRGGSWGDPLNACRVANRGRVPGPARSAYLVFRLVVEGQ